MYRPYLMGRPGWVKPGASADFSFSAGRVFAQGGPSDLAALLSTTRASTGLAQTASGLWTSFAANTPRVTDQGLLVEEARTNSLRNNSNTGGSAPSTLPTNWLVGTAAGLSFVYAYGTENGLPYIDITVSGTSTATAFDIRFEGATQIAASNAQAWTASASISLLSGALTNVGNINIQLIQRNAGGTLLSTLSGPSITGLTATPQRFPAPLTTNDATIAFIQPRINFNCTNGVSIGPFTIRLAGVQVEAGAFATSPILTTTVAVTRAADVITLTGAASTAAISSKAAYLETNLVTLSSGNRLVDFSSGITLISTSTVSQILSGANNASATLGSGTFAGLVKSAFGYDSSSMTARANAGTQATSANAFAIGSTIYLGNRSDGARALNGYMRRATFGPTKGQFDGITA